jgi:tRNA A37 threonylcarbamoyladenosine dehydratase
MSNWQERTALLIGEEAVARLNSARVIVFGVGGVGGHLVEALARCGVGSFTLVDSDRVSETNINRQIIATRKTVGMYKTEAFRERIADINPDCKVECRSVFYSEENAEEFDLKKYDYVVDCIDSVRAKLHLIKQAHDAGTPVISALGAGNKLDPTGFTVSDISKTEVCPLAKAVRVGLRKLGINHHKVVYSKEKPIEKSRETDYPASISFVPSAMGLVMASEVVKDLIK